ncbi:MAG: head-tail connector protein, partial [Caldilineales bacterium]|nr:head-tail connector protein [Caldilineales bacterium]
MKESTAARQGATLRELNAIHIRFEAGYGAASAVPTRYKQALKLLVGHWYENREAILATGAIPK